MIEHFNEYDEIYTQIRELTYKLEVINHNIYDVKGVAYDTQVKTTSPSSMVDKIISKDEIENQISELLAKKKVLYDKHVKEISLVDDKRKRSILRSYYLLKMPIEDIASMLELTNDRVYKLKREAVKEFENKISLNNTK